jgi:hypothetical protein
MVELNRLMTFFSGAWWLWGYHFRHPIYKIRTAARRLACGHEIENPRLSPPRRLYRWLTPLSRRPTMTFSCSGWLPQHSLLESEELDT